MTTTTRMSDAEYTSEIETLIGVAELSNDVLIRLGHLVDECDARGLEYVAGMRSNRGKSSSQSRKVVTLVHRLADRFQVELRRHGQGKAFVVRPLGSRWGC